MWGKWFLDHDINAMYQYQFMVNTHKPQTVSARAYQLVKVGKKFQVIGVGFKRDEVGEWLRENCQSWVRLWDCIEFHHHSEATLFYLRWL